MMLEAVEADIEVLNWELKQKKDLLEGGHAVTRVQHSAFRISC